MFGDLIQIMNDTKGISVADTLKQRRQKLIELIAEQYPDKQGTVFLFAPTELDLVSFVQDSSFFYFSGISEPAATLSFGFNQPSTLYKPNFGELRDKWVQSVDILNDQTICLYSIDELKNSGVPLAAYSVDPYFAPADYQYIIETLTQMIARQQTIFTLYPVHGRSYAQVKHIVDRLSVFIPNLMQHVVDISPLAAQLRRKKDVSEIEKIYQAIAITQGAFEAAAHVVKPDVTEASIQAAMEYIFTENEASRAYPSIVASGKRATILHYNVNNQPVRDGELVLIDAGAMYQHYCADITRVFPVSGKFSARQKELYEIVLDTQYHVLEHLCPGMWLSNSEQPDMSLQHIALKFLKKHGYEKYFIHGIGHYLGLDVHDVGSRSEPLREGDIITIEPGIYIPEEGIGIRIEDNYWVLPDAEPICMSEDIPKTIAEIEDMVQQHFDS